jgi:hypothetical protein
MESNLFKSDAAWKRFQARTQSGAVARRASMEARPDIARERRGKALIAHAKSKRVS